MVTNGLPPFYATSFTPTTHNHIPASISPSLTTLPHPFVAVITGAGKGLGYHISLAYAQAGASGICISSRTASDLDALETEINKIDRTIDVLKTVCDVQDDASVAALEKSVRNRWDRVDVVLANAGVISNYITPSENSGDSNLPIDLMQDADWARVLNINLLGTWRVARAFMPLLEQTTDGPQTLLVNSSLAAHSVDSRATPVAYNVSKMAVCRLVEHVAADHGGKGVVAIALHPGAVLTPQTQNHKGAVWDQGLPDDEGLAGAMCVWLTREKRDWLSGRYVSCNWDVEELEERRGEIVEGDKLKFRIVL